MKLFTRVVFYASLSLAALAALAPLAPAAFLRAPVEAALSASLHRAVDVGGVRLTLFPSGPVPGPGFVLENVTIHDDPQAGIEPFAYMQELGASVRLLALLRGRLELSGINLGDASINLVKTAAGPWNFQLLLDSIQAENAALPAFRMRGGRVNFKFGDSKSPFFFNQADLDVAHGVAGDLDLRFSGEPSRTDHTRQDFGRAFLRGLYTANGHLDLQLQLQRSSLEETLRLIDPQGFGVHGVLAIKARASGDASRLALSGQIEIGDIHRWDLLPAAGQAWQLPFNGVLDLTAERLDVASNLADSPVRVEFHARDYLRRPRWNAGVEFRDMPLATLLQVARHMGAMLPETLAVSGSVSGATAYDPERGLTGEMALHDAALQWEEGSPLRAEAAALALRAGTIQLAPATVRVEPNQTAVVEGQVALAVPHTFEYRISTPGMDVTALRPLGLASIPVISESAKGTWKGWVRYQREKWTAAVELRNGELTIAGLSAPLQVRSAAVSLTPARVAIHRMVGRAGGIGFTGSYEHRDTQIPQFTLELEELDASELERLLAPTLARGGRGFLARTLRFPLPAPPPWLTERRAAGSISIRRATAGGWTAQNFRALLNWEGPSVKFANVSARVESATIAGALEVDLRAPSPKYRFEGSATGIPYAGGLVELAGMIEGEGPGTQLLETARGEGTLRARGIAVAPDAEFRLLTANFTLAPAGITPRWRFSNVEASLPGAMLEGAGTLGEDGRPVLELAQGERQLRYTGPPMTAAAK
jgi:hypothetical protein